MDAAAFRVAFPEFTSTTLYPAGMLTFWGGFAEKQLNVTRWGDLYTEGVYLCAAHYLVLASEDSAAGTAGKTPGKSSGIPSSKGAGDVSVSYDVSGFTEENGGHWNRTRYGAQFLRLARIVGMGGYQII